jgi:enediyne biosynthesis protein E5
VTPAAVAAPAARPAPRVDPRYLSAGLITVILVVGHTWFHMLAGLDRLALAIGTALAAELVLSRWLRGTWPNLASAYISGISVGILTQPKSALLWPFVAAALLSIGSKYVLTYRGRHLWNPTNFGVSAMLLADPDAMAILSTQWGNTWIPVAVIWALGLAVVWRVGRFHVTVTYLLAFLALAAVRSAINGNPILAEIAPITGPMYQLFLFFMITDPRTTVRSRAGRIVVALIIAVVETGIRLASDFSWSLPEAFRAAPPLLALAIVGPAAMAIDLWRAKPRAHRADLELAGRPAEAR